MMNNILNGRNFFLIAKSTIFSILIVFSLAGCTTFGKTQGLDNNGEIFEKRLLEIPLCPGTEKAFAEDHEVHTYSGFQLCYRESYEQAEWVSYTITREELIKVTGRLNNFRPDTQISTGSAELSDYKNSGYDRGHLAPSGDMTWSFESASDSFLLSNMSPQTPAFNRGMWKKLEEEVRKWADNFGYVVVITGPLLEKNAGEYECIGENKVAVPQYYYKVLLTEITDEEGNSFYTAAAFIMPNEDIKGSIWDYAVSVDEVEKRSGLNFFYILNDSIEDEIESCMDFSIWKE